MRSNTRIVQNNIDAFIKRAESINGNVAITELMPDAFIQQHTQYPSLQALVDAAEAKGIVHNEHLPTT